MTGFTTRVELHDAQWEQYETLHQLMASEGFSRTIKGDDGVVYDLPWAEYNMEANLTRAMVLEKAKRAAAKTQKAHAILVTESAGRTWTGLSRAHASHAA